MLVDAERVADDDLSVNRTTTTIGDTEYRAVRFDYITEGATYAWMFEEETGLLLFHRFDTGEDGSHGFQQFLSMRRLRLPWRSTAAPEWVERGLKARYEGSYTTVIPGGEPIPLPLVTTVEVKRVQARWSLFTVADSVGGQGAWPVERVTGVAHLLDALWLPAEALAASPRRSLIDTDPVTGARVTFARRGSLVVLTEEGASWSTQLSYDANSGALLRIYGEKQVGIATIVIDAQLVD